MLSTRILAALVLCALSALLGAQTIIVNDKPAVIGFVDLSMNGGTQIASVQNDSEHNIVTTNGNPLFPAGNVRIGNNGVAIAGITAGEIGFGNVQLPNTGPFFLPAGIPGLPAICAFWDDLHTPSGITFPFAPAAQIWWKDDAGVLTIMWKGEYHFNNVTPGQTITFEIQVFASPAFGQPWIQMLYPDTTFGGTMAANDHGLSASVGYLNPAGGPAPWSFNTASVPDGTVLSITPTMLLTPSSPSGTGSIRLDISSVITNGQYFLAATTFAGAYPNGWLYGVDIPILELLSELSAGFPFNGTLGSGFVSIGPFTGAPSGLTVYAIAFGSLPGSGPTLRTQAISYVIP
jgi:hypothetical protein